jgi:hypothetical protein
VTRSRHAVLAAIERRLAAEPQHVLPALQLIADPDALIDPHDEVTISLARTLNAHRVVAGLREFRAHAFSTDDVRDMLGGVSRQAVSQRVRNNRLMSMEISGKSWFPDWQFAGGRPVAGLPQVIAALCESNQDTYTADAVMRTPYPEEKGRTLAELLHAGELDRALHYIRIIGGGF